MLKARVFWISSAWGNILQLGVFNSHQVALKKGVNS